MVGQRDRDDPALTEYLARRMAQLLAESRPRRARADETGSGAGSGSPTSAAPGSLGPPDLLPSDDTAEDPPRHPMPRLSRLTEPRLRDPAPLGSTSSDGLVDTLDDWSDPPPARRFRRAHVGVVAVLLVIGVLFAGWSTLRARPVAIASTPSVSPVTTGAQAPSASRSPSPEPASEIMVHVLGAVQKPGVVTLPDRARVRDALGAAGGLKANADPGELNLAQVLADGQQVVVGTVQHPSGQVRDGAGATGSAGPGTGQGGSNGSGPGSAQVDLNHATQAQLEELPGVGPVMAAKILAWREEHSRFSRVEELQEIDGVGPKTYAQLAPRVRV